MKSLAGKAFSAILILSAPAIQGGCVTTGEPRIVTREVAVPIHAPCTEPEPPAPDFADDDADLKAAPNLFERVKLMAAGRIQHFAYEAELQAWGRACAG